MALFHKDIGFPEGFCAKVGTRMLIYTQHAKNAALNDRYGVINLPKYVNTSDAEIIEAEIEGQLVLKLVYRVSYNKDLDLVLAVIPVDDKFLVKTVWLNRRTDKHKTLNRRVYAIPKKVA